MVDTPRLKADILGLFPINTTGLIGAQDFRDLIASVMPGGRHVDQLVVGSNMSDFMKAQADFVADGIADIATINLAFAALPSWGGTVALLGLFAHAGALTADKISIAKYETLFFCSGSQITFSGDNTSDHHVIDVDGTTTPVIAAQVLGNGTIICQNSGDHGIRMQGDVVDCLVGDGLIIEHDGSIAISLDEGLAITGVDRMARNTFRKMRIKGFARNIEMGSNAFDNVLEQITSIGGSDGFQLTGRVATPTGVKFNDDSEGYINLANAFDNNPASSVSVQDAATNGLSTTDELLVACDGRTKALYFDLAASLNSIAAIILISLSDGAGGWISVKSVRNGTASAGVPFAQDGEIEWTLDDDWAKQTEDGLSAYWVRLVTSVNLDSFDVNEIYQRKFPHSNIIRSCRALEGIQNGIYITSGRYNIIEGNTITNMGQSAVNIDEASSLRGLSYANIVKNNVLEGCADNGVTWSGAPGTQVEGNTSIANAKSGMVMGDGNVNDSTITNNQILNNGLEGIATRGERIRISGDNVIKNNGRDISGTDPRRAGVRIISGDVILSHSSIGDDEESTQTYAVYVDGGSNSKIDLSTLDRFGNSMTPDFVADAGTDPIVIGINNLLAAVAPGVTDDITLGYWPGSMWIDKVLDNIHICSDNADGAAVWKTV